MILNKSESKYFHTAVRFDEALLALLEKKSFEYLTVSEICKAAGVNRSTFYLHYENLSDLLNETSVYVLGKFFDCFPEDRQQILSELDRCDVSELNFITDTYLHPYLEYIRENRRIFTTVLSHPTAFEFDAIFQRMFDHVFQPIMERYRCPKDEQRFMILFYLNGVMAIVAQWLADDCRKDIDAISKIVRRCIFGSEMPNG